MIHSEAPPLWAQMAAVAIVATAFAVGGWLYSDYRGRIDDAIERDDAQRLEAMTNNRDIDDDTVRIIAVGSSLLESATPSDEFMAEYGRSLGLSISYTRLIRSGGGTRDWRPLMEAVLQTEFDILVVDRFYLFYQARVRYKFLTKYLATCRGLIERVVRERSGFRLPPSPEEVVREKKHWRTDLTSREVSDTVLARRRQILSEGKHFGIRQGAKEIFSRVVSRGGKVVIVVPPLGERVLASYPQGHLATMGKEIEQLHASGLVEVLTCPLHFAEEDYRDLRHLLPLAGEQYSLWLLDRLARPRRPRAERATFTKVEYLKQKHGELGERGALPIIA